MGKPENGIYQRAIKILMLFHITRFGEREVPEAVIVSKRIGIAEGRYKAPDNLDMHSEEAAAYLMGESI